ncbi:MAG TPA: sigma-70 family RNA polymerase sigma factor [Puia sp.]
MDSANDTIYQLTDHLFRHQSGKMIAVLTRIFGLHNIELAEDVVQDAFAQALRDWTYKIPANPAAWLMTTAKNKTVDLIRKEKHKKKFAEETSALLQSEYTIVPVIENLFLPDEIKDSELRMIFTCCHPSLSGPDQIALTLKTCSGFGIEEIAAALLTNRETIKKRIQRAKKMIRENDLRFVIPAGNELTKRLDTVLRSIYLLFNEGYNSSSKSSLIRKDLCEEALRLALMLTENEFTDLPKSFALVSLMTLLVARFESRLDPDGEIILLEEQDRSKWNDQLIRIGCNYLNRSAEGNELTEYHIEASIIAEYSTAKDFATTNWKNILLLYDRLISVNPSPIVLLNRAIVVGKISGAKAAIAEINAIPGIEKFTRSNYLFPAVLGEMYKLENNKAAAIRYFEQAIALPHSEVEKRLIQRKLQQMLN